MDQVSTLIPVDVIKIRNYMDKIDLLIPNNELDTNHIGRIIYGVRHGMISKDEKMQLLISIITKQLKEENRDSKNEKIRYLTGISDFIHSPCKHCRGLGFITVPEVEKIIIPCPGNEEHDMLSCQGSGIKTTLCNRCNGMTLKEILDIRTGIMTDQFKDTETGQNIIKNFGHLTKLRINKLTQEFIKKNENKTFIVISAENGKYCFIPERPCTACHGTGRFVHDRKGIRCNCGGMPDCSRCRGVGTYSSRPITCTACKGHGHLSKKLIMTGNVKSFILCDHCHGDGQLNLGNPVLNIKIMSDEVRRGLNHFFKTMKEDNPDDGIKGDSYKFNGIRSMAAEQKWFQSDPETFDDDSDGLDESE